jgi:hypothetical protein
MAAHVDPALRAIDARYQRTVKNRIFPVPDRTHGDDEVDGRGCLRAKDAVDVSKIAVLSDDAVPFPRDNEWHRDAHTSVTVADARGRRSRTCQDRVWVL